MALIKLAALSALGYVAYRTYEKYKGQGQAAYASAQQRDHGDSPIRDAGPQAMRDSPQRPWTKTDEESDESFPASDPPANY